MKNLIIIIGFAFSFLQAYSQVPTCGNHSESYEEELLRRQLLKTIQTAAARNSLVDEITYIAIKPHLFGRDDGTGYANEQDLNEGLAKLNKEFITINVQFYFSGSEFAYYPNTKFYSYQQSSAETDSFHKTNGAKNAINVYLHNSVTATPSSTAGFSYFTPSSQFYNRMTIMNKYFNDGVTTHEIGHYFGLYHTFNNSSHSDISRRELVTRVTEVSPRKSANCENSGDYVCDTPSDPYGVKAFEAGCFYKETITDANNDIFKPSLDNIMSYFVYCERTKFTQGQYDRMKDGVTLVTSSQKDYTLNAPETTQIAPTNVVANNKGGDYKGKIELTWNDNSSSETGYIIERSENKKGPFIAVSGVKANTTRIVLKEESNNTIYYRIKPSNTKAIYSAISNGITLPKLCANNALQSCVLDADETKPAYRIEEVTLKKGTKIVMSNIKSGCSIDGTGNYYNSIAIDISPNEKFDFSIKPKVASNSSYAFYAQIYVDWNTDGDFEDESEKLFSSDVKTLMESKGNITMPSNLVQGEYRMRVVLSSSSTMPNSCYSSLGEIEDYKLRYGTSLSNNQYYTNSNIYCYPTAAQNEINIKYPSDVEIKKFSIYDINARKIMEKDFENAPVNVSNLAPGMYFMNLSTKDKIFQVRFIKI